MTWRKLKDRVIKMASVAAALVGLAALGWILWTVIVRGSSAFNWAFFTRPPSPPGQPGGGLANAIVGTFLMTGLATLIGVPVGILAGVYLAEFGKRGWLANQVRLLCNVLMGVPSIIIGVFVYTLIVVPSGHFSGYAGAAALAVIMIPLVARTTEDMLNLVPNTLRESALALGAPRWRVTLGVVFRAAKSGLATGVLLGVARVSGETAPLLFTALNSQFWMKGLSGPTANLTVTVFNYAMSPFEDWQRMAWGASLLITVSVLVLTVLARHVFGERTRWS